MKVEELALHEKVVCVERFQTFATGRGQEVRVGKTYPADHPIAVTGARFFEPVVEPEPKE